MPPALRIVRNSSFTPKPWKNGGGVTYEAMKVPPDAEHFEWRVSVAHIDASGPFSDFTGYNRYMVLIRGAGIELEFADGSRRSLRRVGDLAEFDGALGAHCTLGGGPCVDLNLMVAKPRAASAGVQLLDARRPGFDAHAAAGEAALIFGIDAAVAVTAEGLGTEILAPWDLCVIADGSARVARRESHAAADASAVFFATIGH